MAALQINNPLYIHERQKWRAWLEENFETAKETWLVYPHKDTGKARILYSDAVEEALCFGWIDSTIKTFGSHQSAQRFTPRKSKSNWSQLNIERLNWLAKEKLLHPKIEVATREIRNQKFVFSEDIIEALKENPVAWKNYQSMPEGYKRIRIAYIDISRNNEEYFQKRLQKFIKKTEANKLIAGYGGTEKYYV